MPGLRRCAFVTIPAAGNGDRGSWPSRLIALIYQISFATIWPTPFVHYWKTAMVDPANPAGWCWSGSGKLGRPGPRRKRGTAGLHRRGASIIKNGDLQMKRISLLWLLVAAALVCTTAPSSYAQESQRQPLPGYSKSIPLRNLDTGETMTPSAAIAAVNAASTASLPVFNYSITSPVDDNTYTGMMVGRSPLFHGARSTSIPTVVIPLILKIAVNGGSGTDTYDPTAADPSCSPSGTALTLEQNSPIFNASDIHMGSTDIGNTIYSDAFERGEFWSNVSITGNAFHTLLAASTMNAVTVTVPAADGQSYPPSAFEETPCEHLGVLDVNYVNNTLLPSVLASLASKGVGPTTFPLFLIYNVVMGDPGTSPFSNCCILGFHSGFQKQGQGPQFYGIADFDTTGFFGGDISVTSHEVNELLNDPNGENATPAWGNIGQVSGCQTNLEVGDPLTGTYFPAITMNNFTYHPQELAFYSWFFRQSPSIGVNGWFSDNGTFMSSQSTVCQ